MHSDVVVRTAVDSVGFVTCVPAAHAQLRKDNCFCLPLEPTSVPTCFEARVAHASHLEPPKSIDEGSAAVVV